jgi:ribonuclease III
LALTHSSTSLIANNSGLAWLGDAALMLYLTERLAVACPSDTTAAGQLRIRLCSRVHCARTARAIGLDAHILLGKSQLAGGPGRHMIAESFEALLGAVYTDGGMEAMRRVYDACCALPWGRQALQEYVAAVDADEKAAASTTPL